MRIRIPVVVCLAVSGALHASAAPQGEVGSEKSIDHLGDGLEYELSLKKLLKQGEHLFGTKWTRSDGMGRPNLKGSGAPLADPSDPLVFPRNFNRLSSPEANSCRGCHNDPRIGGSGEFVTNAFVLAERFDYATFDGADGQPTKGSADENGVGTELQTIGNMRSPPSLFGVGYLELLAREITLELRTIRDSMSPGATEELTSKGISYGSLTRGLDGSWDTTLVEGLPPQSLLTTGPLDPPNLVVQAFGHAGATVSVRQFTNGAFNHHLGLQTVERFGDDFDVDLDGVENEVTRADVTAIVAFQATLPPPGRIIPKSDSAQAAILVGESLFVEVGCAQCHIPCLPLDNDVYVEPNPFNPAGNLLEGSSYHAKFGSVAIDLSDKKNLPSPRLKGKGNKPIEVYAFTDFKLHDITNGPGDPNYENLDMLESPGSPTFLGGNGEFLTAKLWGVANTMPYFHHGQFTTLEDAIEAHAGEATAVMAAYHARTDDERASILEFLKTLRILPEKTKSLVIDEKGKKVKWPKFPWVCGQVPTDS